MPKYMALVNYRGDGVEGLLAEGGTKRREAVRIGLASLGASLESFHYAFGDTDVFNIIDFPDEVSAAAWSLIVNSSGAASLRLIPLLTPEDVDAAVAKTPSYRAPGT